MAPDSIPGSVAVVTGAASGIGRGVARLFAERGARVGLIDRDAEGLRALAEELGGASQVLAVPAAVTDAEAMGEALARIERELGPIASAFNGAGVRGTVATVEDLSLHDWKQVIDVNLTGTFVSLQAELRLMTPRGRGSIVNCASVLGLVGGGLGSSQYTASKHAVIGLTKTASLEAIGSGVRVNAIAPGFTETAMMVTMTPGGREALDSTYGPSIPIGRLADPAEIAEAVVWMCSDAASYLVGHTMLVDGGLITGMQRVMQRPPAKVDG